MSKRNDELFRSLLHDEAICKEHYEMHGKGKQGSTLGYQMIEIQDKGIAVLVKNNTEILAVFENDNELLMQVLLESGFEVEEKGGKKIEPYLKVKVVGVRDRARGVKPKIALGRLVAIAYGMDFKKGQVLHHKSHPILNRKQDIQVVTARENARLGSAPLTKVQALDVIKNEILELSDEQWLEFMQDIKEITQQNNKQRLITITSAK